MESSLLTAFAAPDLLPLPDLDEELEELDRPPLETIVLFRSATGKRDIKNEYEMLKRRRLEAVHASFPILGSALQTS